MLGKILYNYLVKKISPHEWFCQTLTLLFQVPLDIFAEILHDISIYFAFFFGLSGCLGAPLLCLH